MVVGRLAGGLPPFPRTYAIVSDLAHKTRQLPPIDVQAQNSNRPELTSQQRTGASPATALLVFRARWLPGRRRHARSLSCGEGARQTHRRGGRPALAGSGSSGGPDRRRSGQSESLAASIARVFAVLFFRSVAAERDRIETKPLSPVRHLSPCCRGATQKDSREKLLVARI